MDKNFLIDDITEYIMANATMIEHALASRDMQMLKDAFINFCSASKETAVRLSFKEYIGNDENSSRKIFFDIPKSNLEQYLGITENSIVNLDIDKFIEACGNEDIASIYAEAFGVTNEHIIYCEDFEIAYADYIRRTQIFNPDIDAKAIASKEDYYNKVYYANKMAEQESEQER